MMIPRLEKSPYDTRDILILFNPFLHKNSMFHRDQHPPIRCLGDLGNPMKRPKLLGTLLGTHWPSPSHSRQISGMFRTDFGDVLGRFWGYSGHVS
jgi:hypothetical protein